MGAAQTPPAIEQTLPTEDAPDGAPARQLGPELRSQALGDGQRANEAERTFLEGAPRGDDAPLHGRRSAVRGTMRDGGTIRPIDLIERKLSRTGQPVLDGAQENPMAARHLALRLTLTHRRHELAALLSREFLMARTLRPLTHRSWHLPFNSLD